MGIAQTGKGTLIINEYPFSHNFPSKIYLTSILHDIVPILLFFGHFGVCFTIFLFYLKFKSFIINCTENLLIFPT